MITMIFQLTCSLLLVYMCTTLHAEKRSGTVYAHRYYQSGSFNVQPYHECVERWGDGSRKHYSRWNNEAQCTANGGQWLALSNYLERAPRELARRH